MLLPVSTLKLRKRSKTCRFLWIRHPLPRKPATAETAAFPFIVKNSCLTVAPTAVTAAMAAALCCSLMATCIHCWIFASKPSIPQKTAATAAQPAARGKRAATCLIINQLGFGNVLSNVVTAAGVGALIISLGAQSIIKDVIAGAIIMFERQYAVGDFVKINEHEGTVSSLAMRCTYLKNWKGQQIIIPNGQITTVINYSGEFNMAIVEVPVAYEEDTDRVFAVLKDVADRYYEENKEICYEEPSVLGINSFDESSLGFSIIMKAVKRNHYKIQRDLRVLIKKRFDEEGISIPFSQIVVHNGDK